MSFLSPFFLWGLPLLAAPFIIHFFSRRQREVVRWAAMDFLLASSAPRRRFMRLKDLLLMLLRMAIVLLVLAALARPMVSVGWLGATGPRDVVVILDNSMSTARKLASGTVFDRELDETAKLLHQLNSADRVRVMLASPAPEWLTDSPQEAGGATQDALISRLRQLTPNDGSADVIKAVQAALKAPAAGAEMSRYLTVVGDGQAVSWRPGASNEWSALKALAQKAKPPVVLRSVVADDPAYQISNLAVEKLAAGRAVAGINQSVVLTATIKNTGTLPSQPASLSWTAGGQSLGLSTVPPLGPGADTTVTLSQPFPTPGLVDIACKLGVSDDLSRDDSARFLLDVTQSVPVLLVDGDRPSDPVQSDSAYFLAALGASGGGKSAGGQPGVSSIFQPLLVNYREFASQKLANFQCVVLADVPSLPDEVVQKLAQYVNAGGSLWVALGDQTEIAAFNRAFYQSGAGLSPVSLGQPVGDALNREKFTGVAPPAAENPATALLADTHRLDIDRVRVFRRHQLEVGNDKSISVMLRVEGGAGLAVEKDFGRGRVIVQAIPLNLAWSNLPLCHSFVVMVHEWLWYLTESGMVRRNLQPGEPLQIARPLDASTGGASVQLPGGGGAQVVGREEQGRMTFHYSRTFLPGNYTLNISGPNPKPEKFTVSRDARESDFTPLTSEQMDALRDAGGVGFGAEPFAQPASQRVAAPPKPLASWLLMALVALLASEAVMAFWVDRRRVSPAPDVMMEPAFRA